MARVYPVADGVLKHQLYIRISPPIIVNGAGVPANYGVMTLWSYKAGGSPVGATRINSEQSSIEQWSNNQLRTVLPTNCVTSEVRTWDYGLDPAPRTVHVFAAQHVGGQGNPAVQDADQRVLAIRSQPVGSTTRNRLNGRLYVPVSNATSTSVVNVFNSLKNTYLTPSLYATNGNWVLISWRSGGAIRGVPLVVTIDHFLCRFYGVQRRRNTHLPAYERGA